MFYGAGLKPPEIITLFYIITKIFYSVARPVDNLKNAPHGAGRFYQHWQKGARYRFKQKSTPHPAGRLGKMHCNPNPCCACRQTGQILGSLFS
ncbi:MAG: hypothetical protein CO001_00565 [Candidatus Portnoybacteria bacterium CG_4_8_14_3_um_filter_40_10]|uniref:Uncharacterized protein n=2 Tax=Candidatus Portnoyibacteriota TaxID=1817913 RepID=A0A2M7IJC0_9BACT|nr:MAG: hypothetical protein COT41_02085 [Candidatus Portnoybacteria bacterium CG08_land_8_20_14_0_20_40_83]PIW76581.1 MAG: hypothetical protein CO001_00565 [Candidatus Portnoybacteria bacterium CG_4_8_14_3_um_filter_40_10]PJA64606.1 MAG: hypothetical protein CO159_02165 [Candidatus Portnoybacteria bacterium CG_4_9_14_3_um_filter_40_10]